MSRRDAESAEKLRHKWREWLVTLRRELVLLAISRHIFETVAGIANDCTASRRYFDYHDWSIRNYGYFLLVTTRRLLDRDERSVSIRRLLQDLIDNPRAASRDSHRELRSAQTASAADPTFDGIAGKGEAWLPVSIPKADLEALEGASTRVNRFVNRRIAHLDGREFAGEYPSISEVHEVVDLYEQVFKKYELLLLAQDSPLLPTWDYDWTEVFEVPWKPGSSWLAH